MTLKLWDAETGREIRTFKGLILGRVSAQSHIGPVSACAYTPDGARVVSVDLDRTLKLWDVGTGREIRTHHDVRGFALSPDGARVVSESSTGALKLWDAETGRLISWFRKGAHACAFSPDGARVISGSWDNTLKLWDVETRECIAALPTMGKTDAAAHHPHRASIACGDQSGSFYLVDLVGITLGPLVVTAVDLSNGPVVRCPVCLQHHPLQEAWLGSELECPGPDCRARLRVNPFVVRRASGTRSWIRRWWGRWRT
jgi:WD40 repeat protein